MKSTTKDALIGIAFAIGYSIAAFIITGLFVLTQIVILILSSPLVFGVLGIPFYYICKKYRGWEYCVSVAVTLIILVAWIVWLPLWSVMFFGHLDFFFYSLFLSACYMLPVLLDGLIFAWKHLWQWLGNRSAL